MADIHHLNPRRQRGFTPAALPEVTPERAKQNEATRRAIEARLTGLARHVTVRPSLFERVADALGSRDALLIYTGFYAGALFTAVMAYVWSLVL